MPNYCPWLPTVGFIYIQFKIKLGLIIELHYTYLGVNLCVPDTLPGSHRLWFSSLLSYTPFPWWGKHQNCSPCTVSLFFHQGMSPPQSHSK